jgi:hypothetical protein
MKKRCAVLSCLGLGDGLISLILSNNLHLNGWSVETFHPFLSSLQSWFPHLPIHAFPQKEELESYDKIFIFYEKSSWMQEIIQHLLHKCPEKTCVLNPIATPNCDYPFWENGKFDGNLPFADNLYLFCKEILKLEKTTESNGITPPQEEHYQKHPKQIVIHPTSSRPGKNWPQNKFLKLDQLLKSQGYAPLFILTQEEQKEWEDASINAPRFHSLTEIARIVYESGFMIGNDSGIGHLASCLGIPTLTICRNKLTANFWRPAWAPGKVLFPPAWIPNLKGLRLRDKHWKKWISVSKVLSSFRHLVRG